MFPLGTPAAPVLLLPLDPDSVVSTADESTLATSSRPRLSVSLAVSTFPLVLSLPLRSLPRSLSFSLSRSFSRSLSARPPPARTAAPPRTALIPTPPPERPSPSGPGLKLPIGLPPSDPAPEDDDPRSLSHDEDDEVRVLDLPRAGCACAVDDDLLEEGPSG